MVVVSAATCLVRAVDHLATHDGGTHLRLVDRRVGDGEEVAIEQRANEKTFCSLVQLLEGPDGERLVRFAYTTGGAVRRGPVTFRLEDLERLRAALREQKGLARAIGVRLPR